MLKKEDGLGVVGIILSICIIIAIIVGLFYSYQRQTTNLKEEKIKSDMLLIQGAGKVLYESCVMNKTEDKLIGTKISNVDENESINKDIINGFKEKNIIAESEYEKYYVLTDDNLAELSIDVTNQENAYYIIGYEKNDIILTCGLNNKYKFDDIDKEETDSNENNETDESKEGETSEESQENQEKQNNEENNNDNNQEQ